MLYHCFAGFKQSLLDFFKLLDSRLILIGVDLTGILGDIGGTYYKSPAVEAKNTFSYIVMQVIWCLKFCNMTKSGGQSPRSKFWGDLFPPVIYAHGCAHCCFLLL